VEILGDLRIWVKWHLHEMLTSDRRLSSDSGRKDFMTSIVAKVESGEIEKEEMTAHVSTLM